MKIWDSVYIFTVLINFVSKECSNWKQLPYSFWNNFNLNSKSENFIHFQNLSTYYLKLIGFEWSQLNYFNTLKFSNKICSISVLTPNCFFLGFSYSKLPSLRGWWNGVHVRSELPGTLVRSYLYEHSMCKVHQLKWLEMTWTYQTYINTISKLPYLRASNLPQLSGIGPAWLLVWWCVRHYVFFPIVVCPTVIFPNAH